MSLQLAFCIAPPAADLSRQDHWDGFLLRNDNRGSEDSLHILVCITVVRGTLCTPGRPSLWLLQRQQYPSLICCAMEMWYLVGLEGCLNRPLVIPVYWFYAQIPSRGDVSCLVKS